MMAKAKNPTITVEVDPDSLGVLARHHYLTANDQEYRNRHLTPPGGNAPGEGGKAEDPVPDRSGLTSAALVAAASE
jgi:hypothetical protein